MSRDRNISTELRATGVLVATIDMPGRAVNVFSADLMDSLEGVLDEAERRPEVRALVFASSKPTFLAGADLEMVESFTERAQRDSSAQLHALCGRLGRLFLRLESGKPAVAAVNGVALGGGLELALACHARVLAKDAQVGLPEIKLGLLPGAGGTQRLPRLIGAKMGLQMLLSGEPANATDARELGIADDVVDASDLIETACRLALALTQNTGNSAAAKHSAPNPYDFSHRKVFDHIAAELNLSDEQRACYPAYDAILSCVVGGWSKPMGSACEWEMECFVRLIQDPVAGNMVRSLFLDRQRATKLLAHAPPLTSQLAVAGALSDALATTLKKARIEVLPPGQLMDGGVLLRTSSAAPSDSRLIELAWLRALASSAPGVWLSDATQHGHALEICGCADNAAAQQAGLALARALRAAPLLTRGPSLLAALQVAQAASARLPTDLRLLAVALAAARRWQASGIEDRALADSAAVIGGLHPAYTGGPFAYLRQHPLSAIEMAAARAAPAAPELFALPAGIEKLCADGPEAPRAALPSER